MLVQVTPPFWFPLINYTESTVLFLLCQMWPMPRIGPGDKVPWNMQFSHHCWFHLWIKHLGSIMNGNWSQNCVDRVCEHGLHCVFLQKFCTHCVFLPLLDQYQYWLHQWINISTGSTSGSISVLAPPVDQYQYWLHQWINISTGSTSGSAGAVVQW